MTTKKEIFHRLNTLDIRPFVEQKKAGRAGTLDYLSWSTVQHILQSLFDDVDFRPVKNAGGGLVHFVGQADGGVANNTEMGGCVEGILTIDGCEFHEVFPIMDSAMNAAPCERVEKRGKGDTLVYNDEGIPLTKPGLDARDVSDSLKRCFVKAAAKAGLGLSLYDKSELPHPKRIEHELRPQAERFAEIEEALEAGGFTKASLRDLYSSMAKDEQEHFKARVVELGEGLDD